MPRIAGVYVKHSKAHLNIVVKEEQEYLAGRKT